MQEDVIIELKGCSESRHSVPLSFGPHQSCNIKDSKCDNNPSPIVMPLQSEHMDLDLCSDSDDEKDTAHEHEESVESQRIGKVLGLTTMNDGDAIQAIMEERMEWKADKRKRQ